MDPLEYLRVLRRRWWVWLAVLVAALAAGVLTLPEEGVVDRGPLATSYTATHTLLQAPDVQEPVSLELTRLFATTGEIPRLAAVSLGRPADDGPLIAARVSVTIDPEVAALRVSSTSTDADEAEDTANAFGESIKEFLRTRDDADRAAEVETLQPRLDVLQAQILDLERRLAGDPLEAPLLEAQSQALTNQYAQAFQRLQALQSQAAATSPLVTLQDAVAIPAAATGSPIPTSPTSRLALAAAVGLLLGLALALVLERLDTRIRSREQVEEVTGLPVIAEVPRLSRHERRSTQIVTLAQPRSGPAEAYRGLRAAMLLVPSQPVGGAEPVDPASWRPPQVLLITSPGPSEGKTSTAVNLAAALAESGRSVLVIDADFRKPMANRYLEVPRSEGLAELLGSAEHGPVADYVRRTSIPDVSLLTSGTTHRAPAAMLAHLGEVVRQARGLAEVVLIDAAPLLAANDATDIVPHVDSVVLVTHSGRTSAPQAERAVDLLARLKVPVLGVAVQAATESAGVGSYEGYGEASGTADTGGRPPAATDGERATRRRSRREKAIPSEDEPEPVATAAMPLWAQDRNVTAAQRTRLTPHEEDHR